MKKRMIICVSMLLSALLFLASCNGGNSSAPDSASESVPPTTASAAAETKTPATSAVPSTAAATVPSTLPATEPSTMPEIKPFVMNNDRSDPDDIYDAAGFVSLSDVIPDIIPDIRYYSNYNFVGTRVNGYEEPVALLTKEAARALASVADKLREKGYRIKIYDAYRPQIAVDHFAAWAEDPNDDKMKADFYPDLDKSVLFDYGYIAHYSGHSRGCTVDMTLCDSSGKEIDMGSTFDYFGEISHPDYTGITDEQYSNRMLLRDAMTEGGFRPCATEWWDFTLLDEPYPNTYFSFPVSKKSLNY